MNICNPNVSGFYTNGINASEAAYATRDHVNMKAVDAVVDTLMNMGLKKNADVLDYAKLYDRQAAGQATPFMPIRLSKETVRKAERVRTLSFESAANALRQNFKMAKQINFEQNGGLLVNDFNTIISQVITEVYDNSAETALAQIFPFSQYPAENVVVEVFAAPGGLIAPYKYGEPVQEVTKIGNRMYKFQGIPYRNYISIDERELTFWRELGDPDISARGILQRITMYSMQAKVITNNRINALRSTIFANGVNYYNDNNDLTTVSYQIPLWNQVTSITDPVNLWGTVYTQTNQIVPNPLANPIFDLYYLTKMYVAWISKFQRIRKCKMIMSPVTEALILQNPNVSSQLAIIQAQPGSAVDARGFRTAEFAIKTQIPGLECEVLVDGSSYLLQNSDVTWKPDSSGFTDSYVQQAFFIPPGSIMFAIDVEDKGGRLGEFVFTTSIQNGGFIQATAAPWFIIEDLTAPSTRGGPLNPSIQLDFGFSGGLQPYHPEATLIGNFAILDNGTPPGALMRSQRVSFVNATGNGGAEVVEVKDNKKTTTTLKTSGTGGKSVATDVSTERV